MKSIYVLLISTLIFSCQKTMNQQLTNIAPTVEEEVSEHNSNFQERISDAALSIIDPSITYDQAYFSIPYPNGDIPVGKGVCTDVIIRAYRLVEIDLQKEVHEDMKVNFDSYPTEWKLKKTDTNIDHRRVPNLQVFFFKKRNKISHNR